MLSTSELLILNQRGLLSFEGEEEGAFLQRVDDLEKEKAKNASLMCNEMQEALLLCKRLFDVVPDWVVVIELQKSLSLWQGAVMWIQEDPKGNLMPLIQVSPRLRTSILSKWYRQEEVIAHELSHAMRLPLHSSRFEEIVAYHTSRNFLRRYLGPLFRYPYEVYILLGTLMCGWIGLLWDAFSFFIWIPWIVCFFGLSRLFVSQMVFSRCKNKIGFLLVDKNKVLPVMARLTDKEVTFFARSSLQDIQTYIIKTKKTNLRWQMLNAAYPLSD